MATKTNPPTTNTFRQDVVFSDAAEAGSVTETQNSSDDVAQLVCSCPIFLKHDWCRHVRYVIEEGLDCICDDGEIYELPSVVAVPIFSILSVGVYCEQSTELRKCGVIVEPVPKENKPPGYAVDFIGFISPRQGRKALRSLVLEYLTEKGSTGSFEQCKAPHHFSGPLVWRSHDLKVFRNLYYLLTTGWCFECLDNDGVPDVST